MQNTNGLVEAMNKADKAEKISKATGTVSVLLGAFMLHSMSVAVFPDYNTDYVNIDRVAAGKCIAERAAWFAKEPSDYPKNEGIVVPINMTGSMLQLCVNEKQEAGRAEVSAMKNQFVVATFAFLIASFGFLYANKRETEAKDDVRLKVKGLQDTAHRHGVSGVGSKPVI